MIHGVVLRDLTPHGDGRGLFIETYRLEWFSGTSGMVQTNLSRKRAGAVVGLHFHRRQADYWYVVEGRARVGLYDLRTGSPTEGTGWTFDMSGDCAQGLYIPPGVGHGFSSLTDVTMLYQVDRYYDPGDELGVAWNDPTMGIDWGVEDPVVSERDRANPVLSAVPEGERPLFAP